MKRLRLILVTLALSAAGCGGVKVGAGDAGPDGDHRADDSGADDGETDAGGPDDGVTDAGVPDGPDAGVPDAPDGGGTDVSCVLGTSLLGSCNL